jgi:hypothetical protein
MGATDRRQGLGCGNTDEAMLTVDQRQSKRRLSPSPIDWGRQHTLHAAGASSVQGCPWQQFSLK